MIQESEDQEYNEWIRINELTDSVTDNSNVRIFISSFLKFREKYST